MWGTGSGGIRAALRKDRGDDKAGEYGNTAVGGPEKNEVGVARIQGVREVYHGISPPGVQGSNRKERSA